MYPIIQLRDDAFDQTEQLGTKYKFWYHDESGRLCLFKEGRPNTGENWAEKVCCELCELLGIPHAHYDFAKWRGRNGVVSPTFVPKDGRLVHGNELLMKIVSGYEHEKQFRARQHTVQVVIAVMGGAKTALIRTPRTTTRGSNTVALTTKNSAGEKSPRTLVRHMPIRVPPISMPFGYQSPDAIRNVAGVFVGYLMLDALVANQDRHDENWGLILSDGGSITLAPTFDHASSLGRNESDAERIARLATKDRGRSVEAYVERARSAFYASPMSSKPLTTLAAFQEVDRYLPDAKSYWLQRLEATSLADYERIFNNVPPSEMSIPARDFAFQQETLP